MDGQREREKQAGRVYLDLFPVAELRFIVAVYVVEAFMVRHVVVLFEFTRGR